MNSNIAILTQSHRVIAAKKRDKRNQIKEIVFDDDARREFLTGFHKRKVAKKEEAIKKAKLREKQERLDTRREHRRALAERAAQNAAEVEKAYGATIDGEDDEYEGLGSLEDEREREVNGEYEGEEQLATVTVVEDFDPADFLHGPPMAGSAPTDRLDIPSPTPLKPKGKEKAQNDTLKPKRKVKKNEKTKSVRYQTKAARLAERSKQRARRTEKAERAGGKSSRKGKRR
ncbi:nucleolar protein 12-domain-containing protein [Suillus clintonianus]|uniref:nucleolar protein 12-domain-containing protein n=1 Tax=Suillus clintonianus TaxID=1904413 RepID=UPI001B866E91|nr:nucleolar protein 12-domain-containing protein [Suillus clintonianus]KAG2150456.1 nucleolar protein 12-domain-containing protein [Suillus clintonianus]